MKRMMALLLVVIMVCGFAACGQAEEAPAADPVQTPAAEHAPAEETPVEDLPEETPAQMPMVYYMNPNGEEDEAWQALAAAYSTRTGVPVRVVTAPAGQYAEKVDAALHSDDAPTLFQVSGAAALKNREAWCLNLSETAVYEQLTSDSYALKQGDAVLAVAYRTELYGLIVNLDLLREAGVSVKEIENLATLQAAAAEITAKSAELGFCAFTVPGHEETVKNVLINLPLNYEYRNAGALSMDTISGPFLANWKALWDMFCANTNCDPIHMLTRTAQESRQEFQEARAAFFLGSGRDFEALVGEDRFSEQQLTMLPIFAGLGDSTQGLSSVIDQFWCVNAKADEADVQATLEFLHWCVSSEEALQVLAGTLGNRMPYQAVAEQADGIAALEQTMAQKGRVTIPWHMDTIPSPVWAEQVDSAMEDYLLGKADWSVAADVFVREWNGEPVEAGS